MPCTSGIRPSWVLHAVKQGFEGVFIASDGDECAFLPDCAKRASRIVSEAQALLRTNGYDANRLRMAAICSVCAEQFARHMNNFSEALIALRAKEAAAASAANTSGAAQ
jgi:coenzyme F420-reducing hydrogenase delta subunit